MVQALSEKIVRADFQDSREVEEKQKAFVSKWVDSNLKGIEKEKRGLVESFEKMFPDSNRKQSVDLNYIESFSRELPSDLLRVELSKFQDRARYLEQKKRDVIEIGKEDCVLLDSLEEDSKNVKAINAISRKIALYSSENRFLFASEQMSSDFYYN